MSAIWAGRDVSRLEEKPSGPIMDARLLAKGANRLFWLTATTQLWHDPLPARIRAQRLAKNAVYTRIDIVCTNYTIMLQKNFSFIAAIQARCCPLTAENGEAASDAVPGCLPATKRTKLLLAFTLTPLQWELTPRSIGVSPQTGLTVLDKERWPLMLHASPDRYIDVTLV